MKTEKKPMIKHMLYQTHTLKTSENCSFSYVFMGYKNGTLVENEFLKIALRTNKKALVY